jgi:polar amino acid transport system substrate-binding protein
MINNTKGSSPFRAFLKLDVFKILAILLVAIAVHAHILWFFERGKNEESFPANYVEGILNAAWWSVCMLITLGCENIAPTRVAGRLLGVVWMLAGVALYSYVTATITSTMTVNTLQSEIKTVSDLHGEDVGTVLGSSSVGFLKENEITAKTYPDVDAACRALAAGQLKAVVYDAPLLKYYVSTHPSTKLQLVGDLLEKQDYGFALPEKSPLRKEINRALLKLTEEGFLEKRDKEWFTPPTN